MLDDATIFSALGDAMNGTLSVRHSENIIERIVRVSPQASRENQILIVV